MPRFSKQKLNGKDPEIIAKKQAAKVIKRVQGRNNIVQSKGTARNYEAGLTRVAKYVNKQFNISLRELTREQAIEYLDSRSEEVGQKALDQERQAIQTMMLHVTSQIKESERLPVIKSVHKQILDGRAYTSKQVSMVTSSQTEKNALATQIAYAAGLRAHELYTLRPINEREPSSRPSLESKFYGRDGASYTVQGKGGLIREVVLPYHLAKRLEANKLAEPRQITDRKISYISFYNIGGGVNWSSSFSSASKRAIFWSSGGHGLRHSYAQERMLELKQAGFCREVALTTVSQELGHFRPEITLVYLR
jgi:integrase